MSRLQEPKRKHDNGNTDSQMRTQFGSHREDRRSRAGDAGEEGRLRDYLLEAKGGRLKGWGRSSVVESLPSIDGALPLSVGEKCSVL